MHDLKDRFPSRLQIVHVLSREASDVELLSGRLDGTRLLRIVAALVPAAADADWFLCGPQQMLADLPLRRLLPRRARVPASTASSSTPTPCRAPRVAALAGAPDGAARVTIRLDGRSSELDLRPDDVPVLEAALRVRSDLPFACKGGVCGTCRARLVSGTVAMDANYALEPDEIERGYVLTCQAHPTSEQVVLDYDG